MFSSFWDIFFKKQPPPPPAPFTTQAEILNKLGLPDNCADLSSGLANLYTKSQLDSSNNKDFMIGDALAIYRAATNEEVIQHNLELVNEDFRFNAFVEKKVPYGKVGGPAFFMTLDTPLSYMLDKSDHIIAELPANKIDELGDPLPNQVAFGRVQNQPNTYYYFDANTQGGEFIGDREAVLTKVSNATKKAKYYNPLNPFSFAKLYYADKPTIKPIEPIEPNTISASSRP